MIRGIETKIITAIDSITIRILNKIKELSTARAEMRVPELNVMGSPENVA